MLNTKITISTNVFADVEKAWSYYTSPEHITHWNFAIDSWHCPSASNELKAGGKYTARMEAKDGSFGFDFEAIYDEIIEHEKIVYTMSDDRKVVVQFNTNNYQTEINITFDAENQNPIEMQRDGWQAILNNFKKYTEEQ